ncbi:hypothetical protein MARA_00990 (plasmid) [Mycolicibacterium arabiense]|uniref:Uncharacterized protein n=1 Tax=Mycolicibacterium arabiense TaxID=1286181 RepID=A0A7I7RRP9_9MYCO|nr:hypothetical protein [Mycolicibacterium arabiense]MCV7372009.1 hypothetical protein [Mycolicibacterium arabiense]BBY46669.1 hypothetical protein MARA_00990 [Mycolicibacterium arabiense]
MTLSQASESTAAARGGCYLRMGDITQFGVRIADTEPARVELESPLNPATLRTPFLFEALTDADLEAVAAQASLVDYGVGRLISEGEPARDFYV